MGSVLEGFAIIGVVIAVGYALARSDLIGESAGQVMNRLVFFVASPALLFTVLATADTRVLFSPLLVVSAIAALVAAAVAVLIGRLVWRRNAATLAISAFAAGYVNANNIGLPVAVYVLGNAAYSAPIILLQLVLFAPVGLVVLQASTRPGSSLGRTVFVSLRTPLLVAVLLGVVVAVVHLRIPAPVLEPLRLLGGASVPLMLMAFGMSLHGSRVLAPGGGRRDVLLATACKLLVMPLAAYLLSAFVFRLDPVQLHAAVVLAALPTAQNVLNFASQYDTGVVLARDTGLLTTLGALPVLLVVSVLLVPA